MNIYLSSIITRKITIPMSHIGGNIPSLLKATLSDLEGKCITEGYLKKNTIRILRYSCGTIKGNLIEIQVVFECEIANPVAGQVFHCIVETITKAGIKCRLDANESPFIIFISRDHHYLNASFTDIKEGDMIKAKVIGQRYEINDPKISIIATSE